MSKVRINDLARELEVKSKSILDALTAVGVTEKKTHSSSIEEDEAEKVRGYLTRGTRPAGASSTRPAVDRSPLGVNLSQASKPGDALKAILERKQAENAAKSAPPPAGRPAVATPAVAAAARPGVSTVTAPVVTRPTAAAPTPAAAVAAAPPPAPSRPAAPPPAPAPAVPARRVILPQTGPRPTAVVMPPAARPAPGAGAAGTGRPVVAKPASVPPPAVASVPPAAPVVV